MIIASYDIACQWSVNLDARLRHCFPTLVAVLGAIQLAFLIPNFHLPGHGPKCQDPFSFHLRPQVGLTHGETVEQEWAHIGPVATSTKEMGSGARHSVLDDHWQGWNFRKTVSMGE